MREFHLKARLFSGPLGPWLRLMRFDRPIGLLLLWWPTWWGLVLAAQGLPSLKNALIFSAGVVVMRAAGCVVNDLADRHIDGAVERTQHRPLVSGELSPRQAVMLLLALLGIALGLVLMTNALTILLAFAAVLTALSYPFFKRVVHWPQVVLGLAFSWAIPMAFAAELGHLPAIVWWLMAVNLIWVLIYDTQYAMADRADDIQAGIKSLAVWLGPRDLPALGVLMGIMSALLLLIGLQFVPHPAWFVATLAVMVMLQRQLWQIRTRQPEACFKAFLGNHWVGLVIFLGAALSLR